MAAEKFLGTRVALILGMLGLLSTIIILLIGVFYQFIGLESNTPETNASAAQMMFLFCTPANVIITAIFFGFWYVKKKKEDILKGLASYLKMYRRIPLAKVAQRLGITEQRAEELLLDCVAKGMIEGHLDRETDEFVLEKSIESMREGGKCPRCGAFSDKIALSGEVLKCAYCGAVIPTERQPLTPKETRAATKLEKRFCTHCGGRARFIAKEQRWFCDNCRNFIS